MSNSQSSKVEQTTSVSVESAPSVNEGAPIGFFAIGVIVNLALIAAYFVWAVRNWNKPDASDES